MPSPKSLADQAESLRKEAGALGAFSKQIISESMEAIARAEQVIQTTKQCRQNRNPNSDNGPKR